MCNNIWKQWTKINKNYFTSCDPHHDIYRFVTGKSSGILSDISSGIRSGILSGISSGILPGISSGICSGISSFILSGILSGISSGISSDILSGILSGKSSGILSGKHSGTLSGISSGILSDILSGILSGIPSGILSGTSSNILSGISSGISSGKSYGILSGISSRILSDILSGISSGILFGFWGPAVRTELGRPQVEVQRCALSWEGPRLRSSSAHWAPKLAKSLAKSWQGNSGRGSGRRGGGRGGGEGGGRRTILIKSTVTTLTWQVGKKHLLYKHPWTPIIREAGNALLLKPCAHLLCLAPSQQPPWPLWYLPATGHHRALARHVIWCYLDILEAWRQDSQLIFCTCTIPGPAKVLPTCAAP